MSNISNNYEDLLSISEAAKMVGVSDQTLRRWVDKGMLQCIFLPSRQRRFKKGDIEKMLKMTSRQFSSDGLDISVDMKDGTSFRTSYEGKLSFFAHENCGGIVEWVILKEYEIPPIITIEGKTFVLAPSDGKKAVLGERKCQKCGLVFETMNPQAVYIGTDVVGSIVELKIIHGEDDIIRINEIYQELLHKSQ